MHKAALTLIPLLLSLLLTGQTVRAHQTENPKANILLSWQEYGKTPQTHAIAAKGNYIWGAYDTGLVRWHKKDHTYRFFTSTDGLVGTSVTSLVVDNNGFVWVGTPAGLNHYDGTSWTLYTTSNGLISNDVTSLSLGPQGQILVGTTNGLTIFDGTQWTPYPSNAQTDFDGCLRLGRITDIAIAPNGRIWVAKYNAPVCYFDGASWQFLFANNEAVNAAAIDIHPNGDIWLAGRLNSQRASTVGQLAPNGTLIFHQPFGAAPLLTATSLVIDPQGNVWVGTDMSNSAPLSHFNGTTWKLYNTSDGLYSYGIAALALDSNGHIVVGGKNNVSLFAEGEWESFLAGTPNLGDFITALYVDASDRLWVGIHGQGVVFFDGQAWHQYREMDGLPSNTIDAIVQDRAGNMWFSGSHEFSQGRGLVKFDGNTWVRFTVADGLASAKIFDLAVAPDGAVWAATWEGVSKYDSQGWVSYHVEDGLLHNRNTTIMAVDNSIWTGHQGYYEGVSWFDGSSWQGYDQSQGIADSIADMTVNAQGQPLALSDKALYTYDGANWHSVIVPLFSDQYWMQVVVDKFERTWVIGNYDLVMNDGMQWLLITAETTGFGGRPIEKMVVNDAGDTIWFAASNLGIGRVISVAVKSQTFLPLLQRG